MDNYKIILKNYRKLQKKHNKYNIIYSSYKHKGLCREDAICNIDINKKIKVKKNRSDEYYSDMTKHIKICIYLIKNKIKYLKCAISRSY
jgi:hypothetical protein